MHGYRKFLEEAPESALTPEAMRRLADLKLEKEYGLLGDGKIQEMPAPERSAMRRRRRRNRAPKRDGAVARATRSRSRSSSGARPARRPQPRSRRRRSTLDAARAASSARRRRARSRRSRSTTRSSPPIPTIRTTTRCSTRRRARSTSSARTEEAIAVIEQLIAAVPAVAPHRRGAVPARASTSSRARSSSTPRRRTRPITAMGAALRVLRARALQARLDASTSRTCSRRRCTSTSRCSTTRSSTGYDFDQKNDEDTERRIADTFRVISLAFSNLGGPPSVVQYFAAQRAPQLRGPHLQPPRRVLPREAPLPGRRRELPGVHRPESAPQVVAALQHAGDRDLREGRLPEARARGEEGSSPPPTGCSPSTGATSTSTSRPRCRSYLKSNLEDLANHYHAQYQNAELAAEKPANFAEAERWYRAYLASFPSEAESPGINYRLADLLLENEDFGDAAREYERTAYDYPEHEKSAAAGYAAIFAHREHQKAAAGRGAAARSSATPSRARCASSRRSRQHEHAAAVLGAAVDDLYEMKDFAARDRDRPAADRRLSGRGARDPALGLDRRRALVVRDRRVPAGRAGLRAGARADGRGRRGAPGAGRQPRRVDLQAGRAGERGAGLSRRGRSLPARREGRARPRDPARGGVRRGRRADPAAGLGRGAAAVLEAFRKRYPGSRAEPRGHQADRVRLPRGGPARRARPASTSASPRSPTTRVCAARRCSTRAICTRSRRPTTARSPPTSPTSSSSPSRSRRRSRRASRSRGCTRRRTTTPRYREQLQQIVASRRASRRPAHRPHALPRGAVGARARGGALPRSSPRCSCGSRSSASLAGEAAAHGRGARRVRRARRLRDRRRHRGRDLLHGRDLRRLQPRR